MDPNNYVAPAPGGGFVTVVGGKVVGNFPTQSAAEGAYNGAKGPTGSSSSSGGGPSVADMTAQLQAAGYDGPWDDASVQAAYARTVNGGNAGAAGGYGFDPGAAQYALSAANQAATNAYNLWLEKHGDDTLAFQKAQEAWTETMQTAAMTGVFNGQPTLAAQAQNNSEALDLMKFDASLSGPANAFKYAQALEGTPNGLSDIVRAASGQYQLPGTGGGNGQPITPLSIQSIIDDINKYSPASAPAAPTTPAPAAAPQVATATPPSAAPQTATAAAQVATSPANQSIPYPNGNAPVGPTQPTATPTQYQPAATGQAASAQGPTSAAAAGNGGNGYVPDYGPLPSPNGIAPQAWNQMDPSQQQLLLAAYGQAGYNQQDVLAEFNKSLKGYGGPVSGSVGF